MGKKDPRVDAFIGKSADFAQPILKRIRKVVHAASPTVEEEIKWGMPAFMYKGMMCGMGAFKHHCTLYVWRAGELARQYKEFGAAAKTSMGQFGGIKSIKDLPSDRTLAKFVKAAAALNDAGKRPPRAKKPNKPVPKIPADFLAALKKSKKSHAKFAAFSPSHQREDIEWITDAKRNETRQRRIAQALELIASGKSQNWRYESASVPPD